MTVAAQNQRTLAFPARALASVGFFLLAPALAAGGAMALAALQPIAGALSAPWRTLMPRSAPAWMFLGAFGLFLAWTCASALWSPYANHIQVVKLLGGVGGGFLLVSGAGADGQTRKLVRAAGAACVAVMACLFLIEAFADMPFNRMAQPHAETGMLMRNPARGATVLVMLCWGMLASLAGGSSFERMAWRILLAMVGMVSTRFSMDANLLAFVVGLGCFSFGRMTQGFAIMSICTALALWLLAAPWVTPILFKNEALIAKMPDSWAMRLEIWKYAIAHIHQQPWIGWGLDASRTFPDTSVVRGIPFSLLPLHPHSASLQIWLETGAVGAVLGAAALIVGGWALARVLKDQPEALAAACGVVGGAGVISNMSFGAWQEWWVAAMFAAAALVAAARRDRAPAAPEADDD